MQPTPQPRHQPAQGEGDTNLSPLRQAWQQRHVGPAGRAMAEEDARLFLHQSVSSPCLTAIRRAEGIWIEDVDGRRAMDFHGNSVHHIGYGHPRLKAAIARQMDDLPFAPRRYTNEPTIALARKLAAIAPAGLEKVLFTSGGSDAIEVALKLARAATGRFKTVSFWDSFHGAGFAAAGLGGEQMFRSGPIGPLLPGTEHVAPFACFRCPYGHRDAWPGPDLARCGMACAAYLRYVLDREGDVAAVVAEPARATATFAPPGYWQTVRRACNEHGALLIFDEIPTGLGKTGAMFAAEHEGVVPDIVVLGKALGGGMLPIAAVLCRAELDVGADWAFGHYTHEKNPLTARAALTTIEIIEDEGLVENARRIGALALARLQDMARTRPLIGEVRGRGLLLGVDLVADPETRAPAAEAAERVMYAALANGLSFKTSMGNVLVLSPPLTITAAEMHAALDILQTAIDAAAPGTC
jgi:4-aminobutyrate aminotransferase